MSTAFWCAFLDEMVDVAFSKYGLMYYDINYRGLYIMGGEI